MFISLDSRRSVQLSNPPPPPLSSNGTLSLKDTKVRSPECRTDKTSPWGPYTDPFGNCGFSPNAEKPLDCTARTQTSGPSHRPLCVCIYIPKITHLMPFLETTLLFYLSRKVSLVEPMGGASGGGRAFLPWTGSRPLLWPERQGGGIRGVLRIAP